MNAVIRNRFALAVTVALTLSAAVSAGVAQQTTPPPNPDSKPIEKPATEELPDGPAPQASALIHPNGPTVVFDTSMGRITCQFYEKQAPKTVANFIGLAEGSKDWVYATTHKKMHGRKL